MNREDWLVKRPWISYIYSIFLLFIAGQKEKGKYEIETSTAIGIDAVVNRNELTGYGETRTNILTYNTYMYTFISITNIPMSSRQWIIDTTPSVHKY